MNRSNSTSPIIRIFRLLLCVLLLGAIAVSLAACGGNTGGISHKDGQYYDENDQPISNEEVTLDIIARYEYGKNFNDLNQETQRQTVIDKYLSYHLPAGDSTDELLKQLSAMKLYSIDLPTDAQLGHEQIDGFLGEASTVLSLADFFASALDDDQGFGDFVEEVSEKCDVADTAMQISKACLLIADLSNNDISNKEEYCTDLIDALSFITSYVPVFNEYFGESLAVVKEGVKIVIKNDTIHQNTLEAYGREIGRTSFFSRVTDRANFSFIVDATKWKESMAPTISDIFLRSSEFADMDSTDLRYLREYLLFRISYEMQNPDQRGPEIPAQPSKPVCTPHSWKYTNDTKATCEESGIQTATCSKCGYQQTTELKPLGHDYTSVVTAPTCDQNGFTTYTCSRCDDTYIGDQIEKLPHTFEDAVIDPTFETEGYTLHTCTACGTSYSDAFVAPLQLPELSQGNAWYGYEISPPLHPKRFDVTVNQMTATEISGSLEASVLYETRHQTSFTGTGTLNGGIIEYEVTFETPADFDFGIVFDTITLYYDIAAERFTFEGCYNASLDRVPREVPPTLAENATWSGLGEDPYYSHICNEDHQFVLNISKMNEMEISGHFTLSYNGNVDHDSDFIGRGFKDGDTIYYEVKLLTPRVEDVIITITVETFTLYYDCTSDTFVLGGFYDANLNRQ